MVITPSKRSSTRGWLMIELLAAMVLLGLAMLPLAYSLASEKKLARAYYQKVVAMEIVDGETEILAAGAWKQYPAGNSEYRVNSLAATNLPPGRFTLHVSEALIRLEWQPEARHHGGKVVREVRLK